eukprot:scaffold304_cov80-Skeletonema_menzelii.AAC.19
MSEGEGRIMQSAAVLADELLNFCKSDSLSEEGLREIIERHGLTSNNNNHVSDYKFFLEACDNERITEEIIRYLLEYFPSAAGATYNRCLPLHVACYNPNVTTGIIQLLIDAAPASVRSVTNKGNMPLHCLCNNAKVDDAAAIQILKLFIKKYPEAVRLSNNGGDLPIHIAAVWRSPEFCRLLIEVYPGCEQMTDAEDMLPIHWACLTNSLATVEYLHRQYPDAINITANDCYPIHYAIMGMRRSDNPAAAVEIVRFLLDCDPNQKLKQLHGRSLLDFACDKKYDNDSKIDAGIRIIKVLFDAHPQAIKSNRIASNIHRFHHQVQAFINGELVYARQANDHRLMTTPDNNGQLPLHRALQNNVRLGSIKLLVTGNPSALRTSDNNFAMPLHVACQHHDSTKIIDYLVGLDTTTLDAVDRDLNTALHYACRGAKYDTIALLLEKYDAVSVSKRNAQNKLPVELLWESNAVEDRESIEYTESVFQLLKTYPETVMNRNAKHQAKMAGSLSKNEKKRKLGAV